MITVNNQSPIADAGSNQNVDTNTLVTLNGSGSSDPDGDLPLTYFWRQTGGPAVTLSNPAAVSPTFNTASNPAVLTFSLTVTDSLDLADPTPDVVVITVNNRAPIANAGSDKTVNTNALVTLDGSASSDPDVNLPLTYYWTQTGGPAVTVSNPAVVAPTFTAPSDPTVLTFSLTVTDSLGLADPTPDVVMITVNNRAPIANAGNDQTVDTNTFVTLNGSGSSDPDADLPLTYSWRQTGGPMVTLSNPAAVAPTFTAPSDPAMLTFTLVVTDSLDLADPTPDVVVVTVNNRAPIANAGIDQNVDTNALVTLDGSGSSDPDGDLPLTYYWTQTGGPVVTLSNPAVVAPTFTAPPDPAVLTFSLTVTDKLGLADPTPDVVVVTVNNRAPIANAGIDQTVDTDELVTLNGSASSDPDGDLPLIRSWRQIGGPAVTLSNPSVTAPTFTTPSDPAVLTFSLVVTDSLGLADPTPDVVVVTVNNRAPAADAGSDQNVNPNAFVTLNGSGSSDPDGDLPLTYYWRQTGGPAVTLSNPVVIAPTFAAPSDPAVLTFTLTVTDSLSLMDLTPDEVVITVNQFPIANAGSDQNVNISAFVTLDGSGSSDPDGNLPLTYHWTQIGGPAVTLSNPATIAPTFTSPSDPTVLTFTLAVTDSLGLPDPTPDVVVVTVINLAPVADAGSDQNVDINVLVTLDGSGSSDPDGNLPLTYYWKQTGGQVVTLSNPEAIAPTFTAPPDPVVLTFTLTVTDSLGLADPTPDEVVVTIQPYRIYLPLVMQ